MNLTRGEKGVEKRLPGRGKKKEHEQCCAWRSPDDIISRTAMTLSSPTLAAISPSAAAASWLLLPLYFHIEIMLPGGRTETARTTTADIDNASAGLKVMNRITAQPRQQAQADISKARRTYFPPAAVSGLRGRPCRQRLVPCFADDPVFCDHFIGCKTGGSKVFAAGDDIQIEQQADGSPIRCFRTGCTPSEIIADKRQRYTDTRLKEVPDTMRGRRYQIALMFHTQINHRAVSDLRSP